MILVIGEYPTYQDYENNSVMKYGKHAVVDRVLTKALVNPETGQPYDPSFFKRLYMVEKPMGATDNSKISSAEFNALASNELDRINLIIDQYKPDAIVLCGARLIKFFTPEKKLSVAINKVYKYRNCVVVPNYSPITAVNQSDKLRPFAERFNQAVQLALGDSFASMSQRVTDYKIVKTFDELDLLLNYCEQTEMFCFDYETNARLDWWHDDFYPTVLSVSFQPGFSYVIPLYHHESPFTHEDIKEIHKQLTKRIFMNPRITKVAHNLKFDMHIFMRYSACRDFAGRFVDTMLMHHLIDENQRHGLKGLVETLFPLHSGYDDVDFLGPIDQLCAYAAVDTDMTLRMFIHFENVLIDDDSESMLYVLFRNLVMPGFIPLLRAEHRGASVHVPTIHAAIQRIDEIILKKEIELKQFDEVVNFIKHKSNIVYEETLKQLREKRNEHIAKRGPDNHFVRMYDAKIADLEDQDNHFDINFNSPLQVKELLYGEHGFNFPPFEEKYTKKEIRETGEKFLKELKHPFCIKLMVYRKLKKLKSTYFEGILDRQYKGRIHTSLKQHGTRTGRLSSANPNMQNMPRRIDRMLHDEDLVWAIKQVKKFFIPITSDHYVSQFDYSQAELRMIANISGDENMIEVYRQNKDIHSMTAAVMEGMTYEEFMALPDDKRNQIRDSAKSANFALVYLISDDGYIDYVYNATGKRISKKIARQHRESLYKAYPRLDYWQKLYEAKLRKYGYVRTYFGRKRRLPEVWQSSNASKVNNAIRLGVNNPIQGSIGEYPQFCLGILDMVAPRSSPFFNTVHDSIQYYIHKDDLRYLYDLVVEVSENPPVELYFNVDSLPVKMKMDFELSDKSWGHLQEYSFDNS